VKSFDPLKTVPFAIRQCSDAPSVARRCHDSPFDATKNRLFPVAFDQKLRFIVSIKGLTEVLGSACKSLHPGSIPGEASNRFPLGAAIRSVSRA
jgi:hypothetical protein